MLGINKMDAIGQRLDTLVPEFASLLDTASKPGRRNQEQNIEIKQGKSILNLLARITTETVDNRIVGYVVTFENVSDLLDAQRKAELLRQIAVKENISLAQTIAVGDGANDLPMLQQAGLGVAYHAKTIVRENAEHSISNFGLDAILYLIGFSDLDIEQALTRD